MTEQLFQYGTMKVNLDYLLTLVGPGWKVLISELMSDLDKSGWNGQIFQIKEKFGSLRFYAGSFSPQVTQLIEEAESKSSTICEECGSPGHIRSLNGWLKCLCDSHYENKSIS